MLATLLLIGAQSPPAATPAPSPAEARWLALQERLTAAAAFSIEAELTLRQPSIEGDEEQEVMRLQFTARVARPGAGSAHISGSFPSEEESGAREEFALQYLGTREGVYFADPQQELAIWEAEAWSSSQFGVFLPFLGPSWCAESFDPHSFTMLPADADLAGWTGVRIEGEDAFEMPGTLDLWYDVEGGLRRVLVHQPENANMEIQISAFETVLEADPEAYFAVLPEDWEVMSMDELMAEEESGGVGAFEDSLLAIGAQAPDVTLIGMDDVEFTLASLQGKTVLLNFWFFH